MKLRKYIVKSVFKDYLPEQSDFEIIEENILQLRNGEFLVKADYLSVDPYMRSFADNIKIPYEQFGFQVGTVIKSKNDEFSVNTHVVSHSGWRDYAILDDDVDEMFGLKPYKPEIGNLPLSLSIGALGMPGMTAYLGLLEICKPKQGDIVCVTSAAGTIGSLVGQIAKIKGCIVIGLAGTDDKVSFLKKELGFHYALNYKTVTDIKNSLRSIAPNGINIFFDNVGGDLSSLIMECLGENGHVAICGALSTYGKQVRRQKKPNTLISVNVEAFSFSQWDKAKQNEAVEQLREWIQNGSVKVKETIVNGFENLPGTLIGLLKGDMTGKALVKV